MSDQTPTRICSVSGCGRPYRCTGFCGLHYARWRKHGHTNKQSRKIGAANATWKGDRVKYAGLHKWMRQNYPLSGVCEMCGDQKRTEYASIDHAYTRNRSDWRELCAKCHGELDGRGKFERTALYRLQIAEKAYARWRQTLEWAFA